MNKSLKNLIAILFVAALGYYLYPMFFHEDHFNRGQFQDNFFRHCYDKQAEQIKSMGYQKSIENDALHDLELECKDGSLDALPPAASQ